MSSAKNSAGAPCTRQFLVTLTVQTTKINPTLTPSPRSAASLTETDLLLGIPSDAQHSPTAAHPLDADALPVVPDRLLVDGDTITIGALTFDVIHLRGHTPGSLALALTEPDGERTHLFTGDSLFPGGVGKTAEPENFATLIADVETKIFDRYLDSTVVYPGHGDDTTLGVDRPHLAEWRERGW